MRERRPITRDECRDGPRPCVWISCRYHLFAPASQQTEPTVDQLDDLEDIIMRRLATALQTCALDVSDSEEGLDLAEVQALLGPRKISISRLRQLVARAEAKERRGLRALADNIIPASALLRRRLLRRDAGGES